MECSKQLQQPYVKRFVAHLYIPNANTHGSAQRAPLQYQEAIFQLLNPLVQEIQANDGECSLPSIVGEPTL
jgi:hypothetical protein